MYNYIYNKMSVIEINTSLLELSQDEITTYVNADINNRIIYVNTVRNNLINKLSIETVEENIINYTSAIQLMNIELINIKKNLIVDSNITSI